MLFSDTLPAIKAGAQTVCRRFGGDFETLRAGDIIEAVSAPWMLAFEGRVPRVALLEIISVERQTLRRLTDDPEYGEREHRLEGLSPELSVRARVASLIRSHRALTLDSTIVRIEFRYIG